MWLDGLYMGQPFMAEYAKLFHEDKAFDDIVLQFRLMEKMQGIQKQDFSTMVGTKVVSNNGPIKQQAIHLIFGEEVLVGLAWRWLMCWIISLQTMLEEKN